MCEETVFIHNDDHTRKLPSGRRIVRAVVGRKHTRLFTARAEQAVRISTKLYHTIRVGEVATHNETEVK